MLHLFLASAVDHSGDTLMIPFWTASNCAVVLGPCKRNLDVTERYSALLTSWICKARPKEGIQDDLEVLSVGILGEQWILIDTGQSIGENSCSVGQKEFNLRFVVSEGCQNGEHLASIWLYRLGLWKPVDKDLEIIPWADGGKEHWPISTVFIIWKVFWRVPETAERKIWFSTELPGLWRNKKEAATKFCMGKGRQF